MVFLKISKQQVFLLIMIAAITMLAAILPFSWNATITDTTADILFNIRGEREIFDDIIFVFIGAEDEQTLGGWPVTRDWYGLIIHKLRQAKAKAVAFDILFKNSDLRYREYDEFLASELQASGNVCLAMTFGDLILNPTLDNPSQTKIFEGQEPIYPLKNFRQYASTVGFSNLGEGAILRKTPLLAAHNDSIRYLLGVRLAQLYFGSSEPLQFSGNELRLKDARGNSIGIPTHNGQIRLNHFGNIEQINNIGFIDLLQALDTNPDSLNLAGKIVLIAPTSPRLPIIKATPLSNLFPATLIHATVAENIIRQNYLREASMLFHLLLIVVMVIAAAGIWHLKNIYIRVMAGILGWGILAIVAVILFTTANLILPLLYPTLAYFVVFTGLLYSSSRQALSEHAGVAELLRAQIVEKEMAVKAAKTELENLKEVVQNQEAASEEQRALATEHQRSIQQLENELQDLQSYLLPGKHPLASGLMPEAAFDEIIYSPNSALKQVLELIQRIRSDDIPVLIVGETGTGKEMIARAIHHTSQRKDKSFVAVNCGALPETLLESELFGHEKGSFTGAQNRRRGRFELADGGTIFLDEITETTPAFQARLLRVLQEGTFERVGGEQTMKVDIRVIAACNRNLHQEIENGNGHFRPDLYYRLNGFPVKLPPLSQRRDDIPLLISHFLKKYGYETVTTLSARAIEALQIYHWPGNVRELENVIRRAAILAQSDDRELIRLADLPLEMLENNQIKNSNAAYISLETQILDMLRSHKFSRSAISQTAKALGNRDRGTITEYFRGICFEELVKADYNIESAAQNIAATTEPKIVENVKKKIERYVNNLTLPAETNEAIKSFPENDSAFKGLPKKYHPYLIKVLNNLARSE